MRSFAVLTLLAALITPAARAQAQHPFVVVMDTEPATLDPSFAISQPSTEPLMANIDDTLIGVDHNGKPAPTIATWTISDGGKTVDFHVKPGIKFQSGDPLTAADIIFSFERTLANSPNFRGIYRGTFDKAVLVNPMTARFIFKKPNVAIVVDRSVYIESKAYHDRVGEQTFINKPIGSGPYRLVDYKRGEYADLEAWPGYRSGMPRVRNARIEFVRDETTRLAKLQSGEADLITSAPWNQIAALKKAGFRVEGIPSFPFIAINFQTYDTSVPWANPKVRLAIAHAIDGDAIVKGLLDGIPTRYPLLTPGELGYDPTIKNYSFDPALAKKLLAEAGFPHGFTMPLYWPQSYYGMRETVEAIALYLKQVGITANVTQLETMQNQQLLAKSSKDPTFQYVQLRAMPLSNANDSASQLAFTLSQRATTSVYKSTNPNFERLVEQSVQTLDPVKRGDLVRQALRIVYDEAGIIGIWHAQAQYAMKSTVHFTPIPHQYPLMHLQDVSFK